MSGVIVVDAELFRSTYRGHDAYIHDLCKSLRIISLVWPTRLIFLAMGEVLRFGFNHAVLDPSDRKGNDMYCIFAIEDKKMGVISYCMNLSLYIMSSCLRRCYSILMNSRCMLDSGRCVE